MSEASLIDGKEFSKKFRGRLKATVDEIKLEHEIIPGLAVVLVGEDPASKVYVGAKAKQTIECGMNSFEHRLDADVGEAELLSLIDTLNNDPSVNGILVQLPLPNQINEQDVLSAINPDKDVDGFHTTNVGRLWTGGDALVPCTPFGCSLLLKELHGDLSGKNAIIIGRSNIVGKPMAALLLAESCTVTIAHSRTLNLSKKCREADIVIAAVGRPLMVKGDWIKPGATVIDVGINRIDAPEKGLKEDGTVATKLVGDVDFAEVINVAGAITPVPGGVGPMTIACLLRNTIVACSRQNNLPIPSI